MILGASFERACHHQALVLQALYNLLMEHRPAQGDAHAEDDGHEPTASPPIEMTQRNLH
jgi:hypothetical protein